MNATKVAFFVVSITAAILVEKTMMWKNHLATNTKLLFLTSVSISVWAILAWLGVALSTIGLEKNLIASFFIIGAVFATAFKLLVFGTIYFNGPVKALPFAFVQTILIISLNPVAIEIVTSQIPLVTFGIGFIFSVTGYILYLNRASNIMEIKSPIRLLRGFIRSWTTNSPDYLEEILEKESSQREVKCQMVIFSGQHSKRALLVPEVHPGPFEPIGSSNLPYQLFAWATERGLEPVVVHGVSGHHLDLPSKKEVKIFLDSLDNSSIQSKASTCSKPVKSSIGYATATGISFGTAAIIFLSLAPKGMEDVPEAIRKEMEIHAKSIGFIDLIVVDSHNSQGDVPSEEECRQLSEAGNSVLGKLKNEKQYELSVGYAHTTLEEEQTLGNDIGPAGIGILSLDMGGSRYALVVADSNNMILGLREKFIEDLKTSEFELMEFCTSDTHAMAAKIMNSKGYFNLGEDTRPEHLIKTVRSLVNQSVESSEPAQVALSLSKANVKIMGEDLLTKLDYTIDAWVDRAKKGGFILGILAIGLFLIATT